MSSAILGKKKLQSGQFNSLFLGANDMAENELSVGQNYKKLLHGLMTN